MRFFLFLVLLAAGLAASETDLLVLNLIDRHPSTETFRFEIDALRARAERGSVLPNPSLDSELGAGTQGRARIEVGISQSLPRSSRVRRERRAADAAVRLALAGLEVSQAELARDLHLQILDVAAAREALALAQGASADAADLVRAQQESHAQGFISEADVHLAELMAGQALAAVKQAEIDAEVAARLLERLTGIPDAIPSVHEMPPLPVSTPEALPPLPSPVVQQAQLAVDYAAEEIAAARASAIADPVLGIFVEGERGERTPGGRSHDLLGGVRLELPLPARHTERATVAEREAIRSARVTHLNAVKALRGRDYEATVAACHAAWSLARDLETQLVPLAESHLSKLRTARLRGEADLVDVYQARDRLLNLRRQTLTARLGYHRAWIVHRYAAGHLLPQS
jgi:outer membrane protein, heavy metal efflux system